MEDEILDYNWVISHELPLKKEEGTLFQQYFNEEALVLTAVMLHDNNIEYRVKVDNPERKKFGNLIHEIHIKENDFEKAHELFELLVNEDEKYPIKKYWNHSLSSLELLLEENENVYTDTLVKMELKRRGAELTPLKEETKGVTQDIIILSFVIIVYLIHQLFR